MLAYSDLRSSKRLNLNECAPLPFPLTLYLEVTNVCNFKCVQCPLSFPDYAEIVGYYGHFSNELYAKLLDELRVIRPIKSLKFYSEGEPFLNKNLSSMIRTATDLRVAERTEVTSNASVLTREKVLEILDSGLDYLRVSIYAIDPVRHREITGSKIHPQTIKENIVRLRELRDSRAQSTPFIMAKFIHISEEEDARFVEEYRDVADEISIEGTHNWSGWDNRDVLTPLYGIDEEAKGLALKFRKKACPFPFYLLTIKSDGDVLPCCVDWNKGTRIGNLATSSLMDLWLSDKLCEFQKLHLLGRRDSHPTCRDCTALHTSPDYIEDLTAAEFDRRVQARI